MADALTVPNSFAALSPEQQQAHRAKIGVRAEAILGQFWRDDDTTEAVRVLELEGWMDVLESCSHSEIRKAWAIYQKTGPRTQSGKLYKPDAGALYQIVLKNRPRPTIIVDNETAPARTQISDEERAKRAAQIKQLTKGTAFASRMKTEPQP